MIPAGESVDDSKDCAGNDRAGNDRAGWYRARGCPREAMCGRAPYQDTYQPPDNRMNGQTFGRLV
jgi:hypothetical protein